MTFEELLMKEKELCSELATVRKEINKMELSKTVILLEEAIKCLDDVDSINLGNLYCFLEFDCENCETTIEADVPLAEIRISLKKLKESLLEC